MRDKKIYGWGHRLKKSFRKFPPPPHTHYSLKCTHCYYMRDNAKEKMWASTNPTDPIFAQSWIFFGGGAGYGFDTNKKKGERIPTDRPWLVSGNPPFIFFGLRCSCQSWMDKRDYPNLWPCMDMLYSSNNRLRGQGGVLDTTQMSHWDPSFSL